MPDFLIRGIPKKTLDKLKQRAKRKGRSLQAEAREILDRAAGLDPEEIEAMFERWSKKLEGRPQGTSTLEIIREGRRR